jgi:hypothetical protein
LSVYSDLIVVRVLLACAAAGMMAIFAAVLVGMALYHELWHSRLGEHYDGRSPDYPDADDRHCRRDDPDGAEQSQSATYCSVCRRTRLRSRA